MELKVFTRELEPLGVVDETASVIWKSTYWQQGTYDDFSALAPITDNNNRLLVTGNIIVLHDGKAEYTDEQGEWRRAIQVTYRYISKDENNIEQIEAQGCALKKWLSKRTVQQETTINATNQAIINRLLRDNTGTGAVAKRRFPQFVVLNAPDFGGVNVEYATEYGQDLQTAIFERALASKLGFDILVNERAKLFGFWLHKGDDLSSDNNDGNTPCIFSRDFDNVTEQQYTDSIESVKNVAYVISAPDENEKRYTLEVEDEAAGIGLDRDEMYLDATNISWQTKNASGQEEKIPFDKYMALMRTFAEAELDTYGEVINFESTINLSQNLQYKDDFNVGDIVTSIEKRWGIRIDARITEIRQTWQNGIRTLEATFGESLPTLIDKIKKVR